MELIQPFGCKSILLFRGSRDGWKCIDFHSRCDNKGATVVLFKTDKNKRCGGYTSANWHSGGKWESDKSAFLFSLDLKRKFSITNPLHTIACFSTHGPYFGHNQDLSAVHEDFNGPVNKCFSNSGQSYSIPSDENGDSILTGTKGAFKCDELEVY